MISLKSKLKNREVTVGSWITLGHPSIAEILEKAGFDWLVVDMEHSAITLPQTQQLVQVIELSGRIPLVRVGENDATLIKRVMDTGAHGVIVPMVNSEDDAIRAVNAVHYPPRGTRGVGLARAQGYGNDFEKYKEWVNKESIVIAQIEHIKAIENLEKILRVEGIDGTIIGPYDLSGSLGFPGNFDHEDVKKALERYKIVCEEMGKPMGMHVIPPDPVEVQKRIKEGYKFIAWSLDTLFLSVHCRNGLKMIREKM